MAITVRNLTFYYSSRIPPALYDHSFTIHPGEMVLITGPSGCGKSTLLACLNGILQGEGVIELNGCTIAGRTVEQLACQIGTVFQDADSQMLQLTVEDELAFGLENLGRPAREIARTIQDLAALLKLDLAADSTLLSGGQKQKLTIGAILAMNPEVLLLDEPFVHVDAEGARTLLELLQALSKQGKTIIIVEHRLELLVPVVDRIFYMQDGRMIDEVIEAGARSELQQRQYGQIACSQPVPAAGTAQSIIELEDLHVKFGSQVILKGLSLKLGIGEMVTIGGANGSGKTTLLKILAGQVTPGRATAKALIAGQDIRTAKASFFRQQLAYVCQNPNHQLFMDTVYRELAIGGIEDRQVVEHLELFGLSALRNEHPLSLSQGQKRLLALAAATIHKPGILLLDEPTVGQDYQNLGRLIAILHELNRSNQMTMITVTHDPIAAAYLGDRYLLANGRLERC